MSKAIFLNPQAVKKGDKVFLTPFREYSLEERALYPLSLVKGAEEYKKKQGLTGAELDDKDYREIIFTIDSVIEVVHVKTKEKELFFLFNEFLETEGARPMFRAKFFTMLYNN